MKTFLLFVSFLRVGSVGDSRKEGESKFLEYDQHWWKRCITGNTRIFLRYLPLCSSSSPLFFLCVSLFNLCCTQIFVWEQNLEQFQMDLFRYRCYLASLQGGELPNPKRLLAFASRPTKVAMGRLGIFSVSSFHALVSLNSSQGSSLPTCKSFHMFNAEITSTNSSLCLGVSPYLSVQNILLAEWGVCPGCRLKSRCLQAMALWKWKNHVSPTRDFEFPDLHYKHALYKQIFLLQELALL